MSELEQREAIASLLLRHVNAGDIGRVESHLNQFKDDSQWRDIIRYEFDIHELMTDILQYDISMSRLLSYDITTLSPFHYAALRGLVDIFMSFMDYDIPVDVPLASGTTALHLAAFGGRLDCARMLLDVYKAEINKQDRYGWSALHYASAQGHYEVAELLVESGIKTSLRDQDGTSAASRAQMNGYDDVVKLLAANDPDILKVEHSTQFNALSAADDTYSQVGVKHITMPRSKTSPSAQNAPRKQLSKSESLSGELKDKGKKVIRRMIQEELKHLERGSSEYVQPRVCLETACRQPTDDERMALQHIGPNTLKGVVREEFSRYAKKIFTAHAQESIHEELPAGLGRPPSPPKHKVYEDIYETVKPAESKADQNEGAVVAPPPLPPRVVQEGDKGTLILDRGGFVADSAALAESTERVARLLGADWRRLAFELPLEKTRAKTQQRVEKIEKRHPGDEGKQAMAALAEWRVNRGKQADVDGLMAALSRCGLHSLVEEVDRVNQEFTA